MQDHAPHAFHFLTKSKIPVTDCSKQFRFVRKLIYPMIVSKGVDQISLSNKFVDRDNQGNIRNYGNLLIELSQTVPDGLLVYFSTYAQMKNVLIQWTEMKILQKILENKLVFCETVVDQDTSDVQMAEYETMITIQNYKKACNSGRGGIFFCTAFGDVARSVKLDGHFCRCVVLFGVPY